MFSSKRANCLFHLCKCRASLKRNFCSKVRRNSLGIQMIPDSLRKQIFGNCSSVENNTNLNLIKEHLHRHGLWKCSPKINTKASKSAMLEDKPMFDTKAQEEVNIKIPPLRGSNVEEHFQNIGEYYSSCYKLLADELHKGSIPKTPREWRFAKGWTRYETDSNGNIISQQEVAFPSEDALVFDVEVCMTDGSGDRPTMATAVSNKYWYSWCSSRLFETENFKDISLNFETRAKLSDLIPFGNWSQRERILIGHNVSFDRSFVKEQYDLKADKTRFLDTMSLHMAISGLTAYQRALTISSNASAKKINSNYDSTKKPNPLNWKTAGSPNSLVDVYEFYCNKELSKDIRDVFVKGSLDDVKTNFQDLMSYCANDVLATFEVFCKQWVMFKERFPHPVTLAGMLEMSIMYLPVNTANWSRYLEDSQAIYDDMERELTLYLQHLANDACHLINDEKYKKDIWLWNLNWSTQNIRLRKSSSEVSLTATKKRQKSEENDEDSHITSFVKDLLNTQKSLIKSQPLLAGYPQWYRDFCERPLGLTVPKSSDKMLEWEPGPFLISTQMRSVPKLMRLMWKGYALHYDDKAGWGYLVPDVFETKDLEIDFPFKEYCRLLNAKNVKKDVEISAIDYQKIYSPDEFSKLISKSTNQKTHDNSFDMFGCKFYRLPHKDGPLQNVGNPLAKEYLKYLDDGNLTTFSNNTANLILKLSKSISYWKMNQKRIYSQMVLQSDSIDNFSSLLPRVIVSGTVTRRAVEATWLTASNAKDDRVGSELKAMIQAPKGYRFVGADVDSQELWIASLFGDSHFGKIHGCTAIGWMTLQGSREDGTDMHSKVSNLIGISRDQAKVLNYGRIYGAGKSFATRFLKLSIPQLSEEEAKNKVEKIYKETKGKSRKVFNPDGSTSKEWFGGSESSLFNRLEKIALSPEPSTPVLGCKISTALIPKDVRNEFMPSLVNWVVQSSAVDYLHLMLVAMKWLMDHYGIDGRFSISIHDEVRYLVADQDRYKAALALQIANLLTRSMFAYKVCMMDLPQSVAFFSRVDIDTVLRKEVYMDCKTPSNPHGLAKGYNIPFGESLTIIDLMKIEEITKIAQSKICNEKRIENVQIDHLISENQAFPSLTL